MFNISYTRRRLTAFTMALCDVHIVGTDAAVTLAAAWQLRSSTCNTSY